MLVVETPRAAASDLPGCQWAEVDELAVEGRSQRVTLYAPLAATDPPSSSSGHETGQEIPPFHEQLGLWRLARDALRRHHDKGSWMATTPSARTVAHARLTELLAARPASPQLHALAARRLASPAAEAAQDKNFSVDPTEPPSA